MLTTLCFDNYNDFSTYIVLFILKHEEIIIYTTAILMYLSTLVNKSICDIKGIGWFLKCDKGFHCKRILPKYRYSAKFILFRIQICAEKGIPCCKVLSGTTSLNYFRLLLFSFFFVTAYLFGGWVDDIWHQSRLYFFITNLSKQVFLNFTLKIWVLLHRSVSGTINDRSLYHILVLTTKIVQLYWLYHI